MWPACTLTAGRRHDLLHAGGDPGAVGRDPDGTVRDVGLSPVTARCCAPPPRIWRRVVAPAIDGPRQGGQCHSEDSLTITRASVSHPGDRRWQLRKASADNAAAPLDQLLVDVGAGPVRRWLPGRPGVDFIASLAGKVGRRVSTMLGELDRVAVGRSAVEPKRGDRRFADPAWTHNPCADRTQGSIETKSTFGTSQ
jgi:hypothetical protein